MNKSTIYAIIGIVGILSVIAVGYTYQSSLFDHKEGIGIMLQKTLDLEDEENNQKYPIYQFKEEDYDKVPKIKYMMDYLLTTDLSSADSNTFIHYGDDNMKYTFQIGESEIMMNAGMPSFELAIYNKWNNSKSTHLIEYEGVIFHMLNFKRSH